MQVRPEFSFGLMALTVLFGIDLPLFGASLIEVLALEWTLLRRIPRVRDWLRLGNLAPQTMETSALA